MTSLSAEVNRTIDHLVAFPRDAAPTVTREQLRELLLYTEGWLMSAGVMYDITSKSLGAGVHKVRLQERA